MKIVQQMWAKFHGIVENVLDAMEKGLDYVSFQEGLGEQLNGLGRKSAKSVLKAEDQRIVECREERSGWRIQRREDEKGILTPFGKVEYKRTYFKHAKTGECRTWLTGKPGTGRTPG